MMNRKWIIIIALIMLCVIACVAGLIYHHNNDTFRCDSFSVKSSFEVMYGDMNNDSHRVYLTNAQTVGHNKTRSLETYECKAQYNEIYYYRDTTRADKSSVCTLDYRLIRTFGDKRVLFSKKLRDCTNYSLF